MATFNAGAIEATLTLDRSAFANELRAAREQARSMDGTKISPELTLRGTDKLDRLRLDLERISQTDIQIPFKIDGREEITALQQQINRLDGKSINASLDVDGIDDLIALGVMIEDLDGKKIKVDVDLGPAVDQLVTLEALLNQMNKTVDVHLESGEYAQMMAELEAAKLLIDSMDKSIMLRVAGSGIAALGEGAGHMQRWQMIAVAIVSFLPILSAAAAATGASIVGLAAGFAGAAGGLGVLGLAVGPAVGDLMRLNSEIQDQQTRLAGLKEGTDEYRATAENIANMQANMRTEFGSAGVALGRMSEAYQAFQTATQGRAFDLLGQGMNIIAGLLPRLTPIFFSFAQVASDALGRVAGFMNGPEGTRMLHFFEEFGAQSFGDILSIIGNLTTGLGRLFEAFAPFGGTLLAGINGVAAAFANWADGLGNTAGFQSFMSFVATTGPMVWDLLVAVGAAIINIGVAAAPIATTMLTVFTGIFNAIASIDPSILGAIGVALTTIIVGMMGVAAATAIVNAVMAVNPFALVVIGITALVAAIIYLWNTNEGFRAAIVGAWQSIQSGVSAVVSWFTGIGSWLQGVWNGIVAGVRWMADVIVGHSIIPDMVNAIIRWFQLLAAPVIAVVNAIRTVVVAGFQVMSAIVRGVVGVLVAVVTTGFRVWMTVISAVMAGVRVVISTGWSVIRAVVSAAVSVIRTIISTGWAVIRTVISAAMSVIRAVISGNFSAVRGIVSSAISAIRSIISSGFSAARAAVSSAISAIRSAISSGFSSARSIVSSALSSIRSTISSGFAAARSAVSSAMSSMRSAVSSGVSSIGSALRGIRSAATGAVAGFGGLLVGAGRALVQGLARGITSAIGAAAAAARRAAAAVKGFFPGSPVREGPLRSWNNGGAGIRLLGMLTEGIEAARPSLVAQMDDIASIVKGTDLALNGAVSLRTVSTQTGSAQTAAAVAAMASQRPTVAPPATPPMPSTLVLRVGDREFTGYLEEIADGVNVAVVDSLYAGRKG